MKMKLGLCIAAAACMPWMMSSAASAAMLWGVETSTDGAAQIVNIDPATGLVASQFAAPVGAKGNTQIGLAGSNDQLFYVDSDVSNAMVYVLSKTGTLVQTFSISGNWNVNGLGYYKAPGAAAGTLYTSGCSVGDMHTYSAIDGSGPTFYWGDAVPVANAVGGDYGGRIFAPVTGQNLICEANPTIDEAPRTFSCAFAQQIVGMAYDGVNLYASTTDSKLYTMNADTGAVLNTTTTPYVLWGLGSTEGTGTPVVPLPAAGWMGLTLLSGLGVFRRMRASKSAR
jgi:hypothetical protein